METSAATATIGGRLLRTRGVSIYLLIAALSVPSVAYTLSEAVARVNAPDVGLAHDWDLSLTGVDERWRGVERGDQIVSLDGIPVRDSRDWMRRVLDLKPGLVEITFRRGTRTWQQAAAATPMTTEGIAAVFGRVLAGAALIVVGLFTFLLQPGRSTTWLILLFSTALGALTLALTALQRDMYAFRVFATPLIALAASLGVHFFALFPRVLVANARRLAWLYVPPLILVPASLGFAGAGEMGVWSVFHKLFFAWAAVASIGFLVITIGQLRGAKRRGDDAAAAQSRALILAMALGLVAPAVWALLRRGFGVGDSTWSDHWNGVPEILFVAITAHVALRHNPFAIDKFSAALVGYVTTTAVLGAALLACVVALPLLVEPSGSPAVLVVLTAVMFAAFLPLYRRIKRRIDRLFFREESSAGRMVKTLQKLTQTISESPRALGNRAAVDAAMSLQTDRAELWLLEPDRSSFRRLFTAGALASADAPSIISRDGALGGAIASGASGGVRSLSPQALEQAAQDELWSLGLAAVVPVTAHGVTAGFLGVGRKRSGARFDADDIAFLATIAAHIGISLERSTDEGAQLGRYRIERRLGVGGMAEVFLAWQLGPGGFERKVAIKRPLPHLADDHECIKMFLDEARIAAQLHHRNIVQIYEIDQHQGRYYIVMELVDGPSVRSLIASAKRRQERIPLDVSVGIVVAVLAALDHAHGQSDPRGEVLHFVHRDITPSNVLVGPQGDVKLVDFGIARAASRLHMTQTGAVRGTRPYMSPEQAGGETVDLRADIYSVAALLYELLTNNKAFPTGRGAQDAVPPSRIVPGLPVALDAVLASALARSASKRPSSAIELRDAVVAAIGLTRPAGAEEIARWIERARSLDAVDESPRTRPDRTATTVAEVIALEPPDRG